MWVAISLVSLILVIILILCVPLDFVFYIDTRARPRVKLSFVWFFGLVDKEIKKRKKESPEKEDRAKPVKKSKSRINRQLFFRIIKIKGLFKQLKDEFSCDDLESADKELDKMGKDLDVKEEQLKKGIAQLEEKYDGGM